MRTEANKMHKSIPLRKQETHSASLMTDLGLLCMRGMMEVSSFFYFGFSRGTIPSSEAKRMLWGRVARSTVGRMTKTAKAVI